MLVETGIREFGYQPVFLDLALLAAGISSRSELGRFGERFDDDSIPLCERLRFARLKSGVTSWWSEQIGKGSSKEQSELVLTSALALATPRTIINLAQELSVVIDRLSLEQWAKLCERLERSAKSEKFILEKAVTAALANCGDRFSCALSLRVSEENKAQIIASSFKSYQKDDPQILKICLEDGVKAALEKPAKWKSMLPLMKHAYKLGIVVDAPLRRSPSVAQHEMPIQIAKEICRRATWYPLSVVQIAQAQLTKAAGVKAKPPGAIARNDRWFSQPRHGSLR
jgi:hypothetical protein